MDEAWESYRRGVKRLPRRAAKLPAAPEKPAVAVKAAPVSAPKKKQKFTRLDQARPPRPASKPAVPIQVTLRPPPVSNPDLLRRLQNGSIPCAAALDLHHMTEAEAHKAVTDFVAHQAQRNQYALLIVTGRGAVLRATLPRWLSDGGLAQWVQFFHQAAPRHGGAGAFYVVLRNRRRGGKT